MGVHQVGKTIGRCTGRSMLRHYKHNTSREWQGELRAFLPGSKVMFLLGGELVEPVAHRFELEARDFLVQVLGNDIHLRLEVFLVGARIFGGKRRGGEAYI